MTDAGLERRLERWLADVPDRPRPELSADAVRRSRSVRQRPSWRARWFAREPRHVGVGPALLATALVVAIGLGAATLWRERAPGPAASATASAAASPSATAAAPFDGRILRSLPLARPAVAVGSAFAAIWVADDAGMLHRFDPGSGDEVATIALGVPGCGSIVGAAGSLWLSGCPSGAGPDALVTLRVDPIANAVVNRYESGGGDGIGATAMNGLVWFVSDVARGALTGVDAATGAIIAELELGVRVRHVTAGFGSLWVAPIGRPEVWRIDPDDGSVLAPIRLSGDPSVLLTTGDAIWVAEPHQWLIGRIDPGTDRVIAELGAATGVDQLLGADNGWIWGLGDAQAVAVDPLGNTSANEMAVPPHLSGDGVGLHVLAAGNGTLWFGDGTALLEISLPGD